MAAGRPIPDSASDVARLLDSLEAGEHEQAAALARHAAVHASLSSPGMVVWLLDSMRKVGAYEQVAVLASRVAADASPKDPFSVAKLLDSLQQAGAYEQAVALASRAAAHASLDNSAGVARLLDSMRAVSAHEQAVALASRAASDAPVDYTGGVAMLLDSMRAVGAHEQAVALASRAASDAPLNHLAFVAALLDSMRVTGAHEQIAALLARDPIADAYLGDADGVAALLGSLRRAGAHEQVATLLARDPAYYASLNSPAAVARLLDSLRAAGAYEQAAELASRAARGASLEYPAPLARLLDSLRAAGAHEQAAALVRRVGEPRRPRPTMSARGLESVPKDSDGASNSGGPSGGPGGHSAVVGAGQSSSSRGGVDGRVSPARPRYLVGQCPESVAVGKPFSMLVSINVAASSASAELELFDVPAEGQDVVLVMYAPGLHILSDHQQTVRVPAGADSRPVRFELRADKPGSTKVSMTAWVGGTFLGELRIDITARRNRVPDRHRTVTAEITAQPTAGAVSLVVRYDPTTQAYRFEFRDDDYPDEVTSTLAYDPGPLVEQLIAELDSLAAGRSGYSSDQTRDYLVNAGARLWRQLVPGQLREQFWDRQHRIGQLTILADKDTVPWELLYPMDPGHDAGFLVEQFPVTRAVFGWRPGRTLRLRPARFVLPEGSLQEAAVEIDAMRRLLDPGQAPGVVISELMPLTDLIFNGKFGLLHFACHNTYEPVSGCSIRLGRVRLTPTLLEVAAIQKALQASAPTVFINACRSAGLAACYNRLDGWASKFLEAGAAAFIGSLWAVSDGASREFAEELYLRLKQGCTLGDAVMKARQAAANTPDDPTWLAYTVYGDPRATISQSQ
jgi:tetratricopeptide (TPR) repeat protein